MPDLRLISDQAVKEWITSFAAAIFTTLGKFYVKAVRLRGIAARSIIHRLAGIAQLVEQPPCKR
jgi:hypothetical protein